MYEGFRMKAIKPQTLDTLIIDVAASIPKDMDTCELMDKIIKLFVDADIDATFKVIHRC